MEQSDLANKVSSLCLNFYEMLPNAKRLLKNSEWTILSAIVMERNGELEVVAMGTGTKCIGSLSLTPNGDILNDSHAEIIMRRAFVRFLLHQIKAKDSIFELNANDKRFKLHDNIKFHMFTTSSPCGDASIYATSDNVVDDDEEKEPDEKKIRLSTSLPDGFTGAKLMFDEDVEDPMEQTEGKIRIKPGKGDRTLSLSCSDKIARWNIVGIQGCMLSSLIDPIYLTSLILADGTSFNRLAMERALWKRFMDAEKCLESPFKLHRPNLLIACNKMKFIFARNDKERVNPSSNSIIFSKVPDTMRPLEVGVSGKRQGVTKKQLLTRKAHVRISKVELFTEYMSIVNEFDDIKSHLYSDVNFAELRYKEVKTLAKNRYYVQWKRLLKESSLSKWTTKNENLINFKSFFTASNP